MEEQGIEPHFPGEQKRRKKRSWSPETAAVHSTEAKASSEAPSGTAAFFLHASFHNSSLPKPSSQDEEGGDRHTGERRVLLSSWVHRINFQTLLSIPAMISAITKFLSCSDARALVVALMEKDEVASWFYEQTCRQLLGKRDLRKLVKRHKSAVSSRDPVTSNGKGDSAISGSSAVDWRNVFFRYIHRVFCNECGRRTNLDGQLGPWTDCCDQSDPERETLKQVTDNQTGPNDVSPPEPLRCVHLCFRCRTLFMPASQLSARLRKIALDAEFLRSYGIDFPKQLSDCIMTHGGRLARRGDWDALRSLHADWCTGLTEQLRQRFGEDVISFYGFGFYRHTLTLLFPEHQLTAAQRQDLLLSSFRHSTSLDFSVLSVTKDPKQLLRSRASLLAHLDRYHGILSHPDYSDFQRCVNEFLRCRSVDMESLRRDFSRVASKFLFEESIQRHVIVLGRDAAPSGLLIAHRERNKCGCGPSESALGVPRRFIPGFEGRRRLESALLPYQHNSATALKSLGYLTDLALQTDEKSPSHSESASLSACQVAHSGSNVSLGVDDASRETSNLCRFSVDYKLRERQVSRRKESIFSQEKRLKS